MTLSIQVNVPEDVVKADGASLYIGRALAAIGFARAPGVGLTSAPLPTPETGAPQAEPTTDKPARAPRASKPRTSAAATAAAETKTDDAAVEAKDTADEQAEVEQARGPEKPLTIEDVKAAMSDYVKKYGMPATQEDGPKIFVEALGNPPSGEQYWKLSLLPDEQAKLAKVIAVWQRATTENPLKRAAV